MRKQYHNHGIKKENINAIMKIYKPQGFGDREATHCINKFIEEALKNVKNTRHNKP